MQVVSPALHGVGDKTAIEGCKECTMPDSDREQVRVSDLLAGQQSSWIDHFPVEQRDIVRDVKRGCRGP